MTGLRELPSRRLAPSARRLPQAVPRPSGAGMAAWPWAAVTAAVTWNLWELRAAVLPAQYLNDSSVHEQMLRFAAARIGAGHDPLTSWFPYLGLGSPQFLHYQGTPAILTGLAGLAAGPGTAFRWSLYLLWCLWPAAIYGSARVLGLTRPAAAGAAVTAPLPHSVPGIGYEQHAYLWTGFGVWTQLWGSWALPFAWALTWRAMADRRFIAPAAGLIALTAAFHYQTGYLAFAAIPVMPFLIWAGLRARLARAAAVLAVALLAAAWVILPLLLYARWAGINQALAGTPQANGYGARQTLSWLVTGRVLDDGHLPVITLLAAAGLAAALLRGRKAGPQRALAALLCAALLLSFGIVLWAAAVAYLSPAWHYLGSYDTTTADIIKAQQYDQASKPQATAMNAISTVIARHGPGRAWAGQLPASGYPAVGLVPMYAYLESQDIDEAGYTLRTASLMTQPEYLFDPANTGARAHPPSRRSPHRRRRPDPPPRRPRPRSIPRPRPPAARKANFHK